ncbi:MAG: hypothetical protein AB8B63_19270 [Granulosicoccus sp.]
MLSDCLKRLGIASVLLFMATQVHAGNFLPREGTVITDSTFEVAWSTEAAYQWVRVVDDEDNGLYESGILSEEAGSVVIFVPPSVPRIKIFFYESNNQGAWQATARSYSVAIGRRSPEAPAVTRLADLPCGNGQMAKASGKAAGARWGCSQDKLTRFGIYESMSAMLCESDEQLIREFDGTLQCKSFAADCLAQYAPLPAQARFMWIGITQKRNSPEASFKRDEPSVCEWNVARGQERRDSVVLRNDGSISFLSLPGSAAVAELSGFDYTTEPGSQASAELLSCAKLLACDNLEPAFE